MLGFGFPNIFKVKGSTDNTAIGNILDSLKAALRSEGTEGVAVPTQNIMIGVGDGTNSRRLQGRTAVPQIGDFGLITRPLPYARATYSATVENLVPVATAQDIFTIIGSATKTVYVHKVAVSGTRTAHAHDIVILNKRSTANTGGTSTTRTAVPHDSLNAAATAVVRAFTANPTLGTLIGNIKTARVSFPVQTPSNAQGNGGPHVVWEWQAGQDGQPLVLRGVAQQVALNLNGVSIAGGLINISIEWSEE